MAKRPRPPGLWMGDLSDNMPPVIPLQYGVAPHGYTTDSRGRTRFVDAYIVIIRKTTRPSEIPLKRGD